MFSFIPPDLIPPADAEILRVKAHIEIAKQDKSKPLVMVPGDGSAVFSFYLFRVDKTKSTGYVIECNNLREPKRQKHTELLPAGFYSLVQSYTGNFFAVRTAIGASSHRSALAPAGLNIESQNDKKAAGEMFVGPKGKILLFNPSSGGYHHSTYANYILSKEKDHASQLVAMGLPTAAIIGDHKIFRMDEMLDIEKMYYNPNGTWKGAKAVVMPKLEAINNVHLSLDIFSTLDSVSQNFIAAVLSCFKKYEDIEKFQLSPVATDETLKVLLTPSPIPAALFAHPVKDGASKENSESTQPLLKPKPN